MVVITLFKDCPFNNGCVMSNFLSFQDQKSFFDDYPANKKLVLNDVKFSKLEEPILINRDLSDLFNYTYGSIDFNGKRIVYFSINRFEIETESKTWMFIDIDYWETYRYSINDENGLKVGRGLISRCSLDLGCRIKKPYAGKFKESKFIDNLGNTDTNGFVAYVMVRNSETNINWIYRFVSINPAPAGNCDSFLVSIGDYLDRASILKSDVVSAWLSPFKSDKYNWRSVHTDNIMIVERDNLEIVVSNSLRTNFNISIVDNETTQTVITDCLDNPIWTSDNSNKWAGDGFIIFNCNMTYAQWDIYLRKITDSTEFKDQYPLEGRFTIPCEPLEIFSDEYEKFKFLQEPFLAKQRDLQREQALVNSLSGAGTSLIGGAVGGAMVGGPVGAGVGAIGGLSTNLIGAGVNYASAGYFNKQLQENENEQAKMQTDSLKFSGVGLVALCKWNIKLRPAIYQLKIDSETQTKYNNDVASFGYFYNTEFENVDNLILSNSEFKLTANCEIENVPAIAGISVKQRLISGVKFIRPT